jgi:hypothetical protein
LVVVFPREAQERFQGGVVERDGCRARLDQPCLVPAIDGRPFLPDVAHFLLDTITERVSAASVAASCTAIRSKRPKSNRRP